MQTLTIKLYYFILFAATLAFAAQTVLVGGAHIANGQKIADLEKRSIALNERQVTVQYQLSQELSFARASEVAEQQGFIASTQVIQLPSLTQVASR